MSKTSEEKNTFELSRRGFLSAVAGTALAFAAPKVMASATLATVRDRELSFYNTHTGEKLSATFWSDGNYQDDAVKEISWILRDHRTNTASSIDCKVMDLLCQLQAKVEYQGEIHVISGYRSPASNAMLNKKSSGVAKRSYHMLGQAIDIRLPGFDTAELHRAAKSLKVGGVGYYAKSDFVHLDVGRVRYW
ncbi:MAG: DUF882 domain-containing protein [Gammaproteobacteria bacterium]|nr:DUF882 domain-containing protein [Gammaproteobacteria bacterium]